MISMGNESGGRKKGHKDSPAVAESCTKQSVGGGGALKKGPWTSAEDAILLEYVTKHGEGNWNAVQKNSGLSRCGKSCRLRWANHLRPDLKKGAFTLEEERIVIALHAKIGNKWSRMATQLPGRTDNEIKNFWNTRIKRLQRTGSPIYPPDVCQQLQAMNGAQEGPNMGASQAGDTHHSYLLDGDRFVIPDVKFKNLELDQEIYSYTEPLLELPISSFMFPKRPRESEALFPCVDGNAYPFGSSPFDPDFDYNHQFPFGGVPGSHACVNGNSSSSELLSEAMMKSELPSLQYSETQQGSWNSLASSLPSLESVDTLIRSPPTEQSREAECISPRSAGLLEAVVYASQPFKRQKKSSEWEIDGDPNSHLDYSVASEFSECTPICQMTETMPGCDVKPEEVSQVSTQNEEKNIDFSVPDSFIDWSWFGRDSKQNEDQSTPSDAIGALLGEDRSSDMQLLSHFKASGVTSDL